MSVGQTVPIYFEGIIMKILLSVLSILIVSACYTEPNIDNQRSEEASNDSFGLEGETDSFRIDLPFSTATTNEDLKLTAYCNSRTYTATVNSGNLNGQVIEIFSPASDDGKVEAGDYCYAKIEDEDSQKLFEKVVFRIIESGGNLSSERGWKEIEL